MSTELRLALEQVARRFRRVRLWAALAACWLAWALAGWGLNAFLSRPGQASTPVGPLLAAYLTLAAASAAACAAAALRSARDRRWVARKVEAKHPELGTGLLAAVEDDAAGRVGYLQSAVVRQTLEHHRAEDWTRAVPDGMLRGAQVAHAAALGLFLLASAALVGQTRSHPLGSLSLRGAETAADVKVEPGDAEVERGTTLLVVARFVARVPADALLVAENGKGPAARIAMSRSLEDPTFAGRVESVDADLTYRVEFDGKASPAYHVRVFEYPELVRADATLVFPDYTSAEPKTVEDVRHVTAVEGTQLTLICRLNKDVASARLVDEKGQAVELDKEAGGDHVYATGFTAAESRRFKVKLVDREGRANKLTPEIVINVTPNRPASVVMTRPSHDVRVSPVEELALEAKMEDDYALVRHGFTYTLAGSEPKDVVMGGAGSGPPSKALKAGHLLAFEAMKAEPDQLVSYFFWAEDVGPDGKPRRTSGDMFFAEVRPFEEIFRQGEPPPSGSAAGEESQGNAKQAEKLAEQQKEIINATWKLVRRETRPTPSDKFVGDTGLVRESQNSAVAQAGEAADKLQDKASKAHMDRAVGFMKEAAKQLGAAADGPKVAGLTPAIASEQAAYQALLKLRAREFEVVRRNNRQRSPRSGSASGSPQQRQLDQLELSNEENRYEEQSTARAQTQREREQAETRQVVNRLKELAQRQNDLNDRVKELQSALEAASDRKAKDEIERQLKRLRDQQQQVLRDTDEVRERMEREENRERMAEARQQLEQSREHVRQASEALEQGRLSQAVTEGARAGRQLNDLKEELRKGASDRFTEELTELRDKSRRLDERQKALTESLDAGKDQARHSLRDTGERTQVKEGLGQQQKQLDEVLERMRKTVEAAEETEPLLARELFETVRKANDQRVADALKVAEQLVDAGVPEEAVKASRHAGLGLEQLREGVERAAKSVLGDETAALKRARSEVEDLADQLDREIAMATGQPPPGTPGGQGAQPGSGNRPGEPGPQEPGGRGQDGQSGGPSSKDDPQAGRQAGEQGRRSADRQGQTPGPRPEQGQPGPRPGQPGQDGTQPGVQGQQGDQPGPQGQPRQGDRQAGQRAQPGRQGGRPGQGQQAGQGGQGQQGNQPGQGQSQGAEQGQGQGQGSRQAGNNGGGGGGGGNREGGLDRLIEGLNGGPGGPITGEGFRQWSDRMRDVEEILTDPTLRAEAARVRDRARGVREDFKRHAKVPDWDKLKTMVADPIRELRDRIAEEVRRRETPDSLVPIDRDPVPPQYAEGVRRYYERLGSGR